MTLNGLRQYEGYVCSQVLFNPFSFKTVPQKLRHIQIISDDERDLLLFAFWDMTLCLIGMTLVADFSMLMLDNGVCC